MKKLFALLALVLVATLSVSCKNLVTGPDSDSVGPGNNSSAPAGKDPAYISIVSAELRLTNGTPEGLPIPSDGLRAGNTQVMVALRLWSPDSRLVQITSTRYNAVGLVASTDTNANVGGARLYPGTNNANVGAYTWQTPGTYKIKIETQDLTATYPKGYDVAELTVEIKPAL